MKLHVAHAGDASDRPRVILLHGFPEDHTSWRHQMAPLADAGFSVHAPDLRGYGASPAPQDVADYAPDQLIGDVETLVRDVADGPAHIVGHDWGGLLAWWFAAAHPELTARLVILNSPHPAIFRRRVRRPPQLFRSWYAGFFLLPALPELALRAFDGAALRRLFRDTPARAGTFSEAIIAHHVDAMLRPGRLTAALNYYRAAARHADRAPRPVRTDARTLVIWGERDVALTTGLLDGLEKYAPRVRVARIPTAGHWVQNEAPDEVNRLLIEFLTAPV